MTLKTRLQLLVWRLEDDLRYSARLRALLAWLHWLRGRLARDPERQIRNVSKALGFAETDRITASSMENFIDCLTPSSEPLWRRIVASHPRYEPLIREKPQLTRSVVLKAPGPSGEKGVLLNYFEYNLARLMALSDDDLTWLDSHFNLIFVASWSPTDYALLGSVLLRLKSSLYIQCANEVERAKLSNLHPRLVCLPGLACDWVDPAFYHPKEHHERSIDILMVANWGAFKRHWEFFLALTRLPKDLRVVLVGQKEGGRDKGFIANLAREIGVPQELQLLESLPIEKVTELQGDSRVSVILSRREGGCVAAVESLFAGCALGMRLDAHIGSAAHIVEQTGRRLRASRLAEDLSALLRDSASLKPHEWAMNHIRNDLSLSRINAVLKQHSLATGSPWTKDLAAVRWHPHPTLALPSDRETLRPCYDDLAGRFPRLFSKHLIDTSHH